MLNFLLNCHEVVERLLNALRHHAHGNARTHTIRINSVIDKKQKIRSRTEAVESKRVVAEATLENNRQGKQTDAEQAMVFPCEEAGNKATNDTNGQNPHLRDVTESAVVAHDGDARRRSCQPPSAIFVQVRVSTGAQPMVHITMEPSAQQHQVWT